MKRYEPHIRKTVKARDDWLIVFQVFGHSRRKKGSQGYTDLPSHPHTHAHPTTHPCTPNYAPTQTQLWHTQRRGLEPGITFSRKKSNVGGCDFMCRSSIPSLNSVTHSLMHAIVHMLSWASFSTRHTDPQTAFDVPRR